MTRLTELFDHPVRAYRVLGPMLVALFLISGVGDDPTPSDGATYTVAAVGWVGFGLTLAVTVVFTLVVVVRSVAHRRAAA